MTRVREIGLFSRQDEAFFHFLEEMYQCGGKTYDGDT